MLVHGFVRGVAQTLAWVAWMAWVCKILAWAKKMAWEAWVAWVHKILTWLKKNDVGGVGRNFGVGGVNP